MGNGISVNTNINVVVNKHVMLKHDNMKTRNLNIKLEDITTANNVYPSSAKKIAIIFCNSYDGTKYALGECAKNDGILAYSKFSEYGYSPVLYHDISCARFKSIITYAMKLNCDALAIYYIGHGTRTYTKYSKFEKTGLDSAFVCIDGIIIDNDLRTILVNGMKESKCKQFRFITDCCHSGTIYDLISDDYTTYNALSIGACNDRETAKQDYICRRGNGIFSYYFWKYYTPDIEIHTLLAKINEKVKAYKQKAESNIDSSEKECFNIL